MIAAQPKHNKLIGLSLEAPFLLAEVPDIAKRQLALAHADFLLHLLAPNLYVAKKVVTLRADIEHHAGGVLLVNGSEAIANHRVIVNERHLLKRVDKRFLADLGRRTVNLEHFLRRKVVGNLKTGIVINTLA